MNHSLITVSPSSDDQKTLPSAARRVPAQGSGSFADVMARERVSAPQQRLSMPAQQRPALPPMAGGRFALAGRSPSDLARAQLYGRAQNDLRRAGALEQVSRAIGPQDAASRALGADMGTARRLQGIVAADSGAARVPAAGRESAAEAPALPALGGIRALQTCDFIRTRVVGERARFQERMELVRRRRRAAKQNSEGIGSLSAKFESGKDGIAAIGYDRTGGTSYGKFQIASRVGGMKGFLQFLDSEAPDVAERLRASGGPANTGSRRGAMPDAWRAIAAAEPERFETLQENYILKSHYRPALEGIAAKTRLDTSRLSPAMREVIWSTAVQHGPTGASRVFARADGMSGAQDRGYERRLIQNVYKVRSGQFGSSDADVRAAVLNRFKKEEALAIDMLGIQDRRPSRRA